jgi:hypothetical protein
MRAIHVVALASMAIPAAFSADIVLTDKQVFTDATIQSQTPRTVIIRHAGGLASVPKKLLPRELQAQYPLDEAAAQEAERKEALAVEAEKARQTLEAEQRAQQKEEMAKAAEMTRIREAKEAEELARQKTEQAQLETEIRKAIVSYFYNEYTRDLFSERSCEVTLTEVRPRVGWGNHWMATGQAVIRYCRPASQMPTPPPNLSGKQLVQFRLDAERARYVRTEIRNFEAGYSTEGEKPSLDITMR